MPVLIEPAATALNLILAPLSAETQPPLYDPGRPQLTAAITTLALGGAERIVLDWAASCAAHYRVRLIVLRRAPAEWPEPPGITVTRLDGTDTLLALTAVGAEIATSGNPLVLCHLLTAAERAALVRGGAQAIPVLHNAAAGWTDDAKTLANESHVITVSHAAVSDLRSAGCRAACTVVHHLPATPRAHAQARSRWRERWAIPQSAVVIGMVGAVKPQKAYTHALRLLAQLLERQDVWLVIVGGPVGRDGDTAWNALLAQAQRLQLEPRLRLPGFIANAADCLPAFDLLLNTSRYEGLSIATLEALAAGLPVVASAVGGQGEITAPGLRLIGEAEADTNGAISSDDCRMPVTKEPHRSSGAPCATKTRLMRFAALTGILRFVFSVASGSGRASLKIVPLESDAAWIRAIEASLTARPQLPAWRGFPSHRMWILLHLLPQFDPTPGVLFVTANLNAGGAQRSLCNLTSSLNRSLRLEVAVCGNSSTEYFYLQLQTAGVSVKRMATSRDCFDHAEALVQRVVAGRFGAVCFWNVDSKVKLLLVKTLASTRVRIIDVSPGGYSFEEMRALGEFQQWIAFDEHAYYARLNRLVLKYRGNAPAAVDRKTTVIPNGVPLPALRFDTLATHNPKIVVSGRIAPSKFVIEIVDSMRYLWQTHPAAELHLLGRSEPRHADYAGKVVAAIGAALDHRVFLHGPVFDASDQLGQYQVALVLGEHQGSPNAVLEAMAAAVPVVANDSGGTRELVVHERTGLLIQGRDPRAIAGALGRLLTDTSLARRLAVAGQRHVARHFSMMQMVRTYRKLLAS